jgi:hypothetical protein
MAWTTPKTWAVDELVTATLLNTHLRDNLNYLLGGRVQNSILRDNSGNYTTTSTSFTDVDATNLAITLALKGSRALVGFGGVVGHTSGGGWAAFDIDVGGTRHGNGFTYGLVRVATDDGGVSTGFSYVTLITGLSGSTTFKLQWRTGSGTASLWSQSSTVPVAFWAVEIG